MNAPQSQPMLLGEILVSRHIVGQRDVDKALVVQSQVGGRLGSILIRSGALSEQQLLECLSEQLGMPVLGKDVVAPQSEEIRLALANTGLSAEWLLQEEAVVWLAKDQYMCLASDCFSIPLGRVLFANVPGEICWVLATRQELEGILAQLRSEIAPADTDAFEDEDVAHLREMAEEAPVVELVNTTISNALEQNASDIHVEPEEDTFDIRFRVDGIMYTRRTLPKERYAAVASRLKLVSGIDIAERRLPQDGRIGMRVNGQDLDIRVSSLPGVHGESIVMRLLPKERKELELERLGYQPDHLNLLRKLSARPHGIVLVTGPTGSGKSTTLYSTLDEANDGHRKIITVEDPVEFNLPHITQVQVHSDIGMTFARALKSILRQDPDVIMIGEIRDLETAEIAVQAALTGHLVLSTLHTNDSLSAFTRLIDMGVEPFLAATPVIAVQAQRLVRRLCEHCAQPSEPSLHVSQNLERWQHLFGDDRPNWREPTGCNKCNHTGYRGRLGIYELVEVSDELRELVLAGATLSQLQKQANAEGYRNLYIDGLLKARSGLTSVEEVIRVTSLGA